MPHLPTHKAKLQNCLVGSVIKETCVAGVGLFFPGCETCLQGPVWVCSEEPWPVWRGAELKHPERLWTQSAGTARDQIRGSRQLKESSNTVTGHLTEQCGVTEPTWSRTEIVEGEQHSCPGPMWWEGCRPQLILYFAALQTTWSVDETCSSTAPSHCYRLCPARPWVFYTTASVRLYPS